MAAGNAPSVTAELPEKSVQELSQISGGVPERYICKNTDDADLAFAANLPAMNCPMIDLELLASSSEVELDKFRSALTSWGCFQIVNHGISSSWLDEMRKVIKQFFELPIEEKKRYSRSINDLEGYGNETFAYEDRVLDWTDRVYLMTYPISKRRMQIWPEKPYALKGKLIQFSVKTQEILQLVLKAMAKSLGMEDEESFVKGYGENGSMFTRFSLYPRCPSPDLVLGIHAHTDMSAITIILQDEQVEGLQVLKDNQWFKVPVIADALFINLGDQLQIMSNGTFKSPTHRVVTSAENERISLAAFCCPNADHEIKPLEELITADKPQRYKVVKNYAEIFMTQYQLGETPLSTLRI